MIKCFKLHKGLVSILCLLSLCSFAQDNSICLRGEFIGFRNHFDLNDTFTLSNGTNGHYNLITNIDTLDINNLTYNFKNSKIRLQLGSNGILFLPNPDNNNNNNNSIVIDSFVNWSGIKVNKIGDLLLIEYTSLWTNHKKIIIDINNNFEIIDICSFFILGYDYKNIYLRNSPESNKKRKKTKAQVVSNLKSKGNIHFVDNNNFLFYNSIFRVKNHFYDHYSYPIVYTINDCYIISNPKGYTYVPIGDSLLVLYNRNGLKVLNIHGVKFTYYFNDTSLYQFPKYFEISSLASQGNLLILKYRFRNFIDLIEPKYVEEFEAIVIDINLKTIVRAQLLH